MSNQYSILINLHDAIVMFHFLKKREDTLTEDEKDLMHYLELELERNGVAA